MWCGRPRGRSRPSRGVRSSRATTRRRTSPRSWPTRKCKVRCALKRAAFVAAFFISCPVLAIDRAALEKLAFGEGDERIEAIAALVAEGDPKARAVLQALAQGDMQTSGKRVLIVRGDKAVDPFTGAEGPLPPDREDVVANNRLRSAVGDALAVLNLLSPEKSERLASAKALAGTADAAMYPLIEKALAKERDAEIRALLEITAAGMQLKAE